MMQGTLQTACWEKGEEEEEPGTRHQIVLQEGQQITKQLSSGSPHRPFSGSTTYATLLQYCFDSGTGWPN
ncbi:hypothetical protein Y1Q_0012524 [Alligator mississippiensis]|uniref:Uncharacterized protein n=1 Tax=Alligator mississippiensis TaxID=8496 RepID=A0A151M860_ALLMI|nr:hypothetical protein Y1Q_0012524 [Alligator mississippiensis]